MGLLKMSAGSDSVHGYTAREWDTAYPPGSRVLAARTQTRSARIENVVFAQADIYALPFAPASFDHVFVCFVLEHLSRPMEALHMLKRVLRPGGTVTVIEGDHGSAYFHPDSPHARRAIQCLVDLQARAGGNALIGRALYPLLMDAGFRNVAVSPRMVYVDSSHPGLVEGFTNADARRCNGSLPQRPGESLQARHGRRGAADRMRAGGSARARAPGRWQGRAEHRGYATGRRAPAPHPGASLERS